MAQPIDSDVGAIPADLCYALRALSRTLIDSPGLGRSVAPVCRWIGSITDGMLQVISPPQYRLADEEERRMVGFYGPDAGAVRQREDRVMVAAAKPVEEKGVRIRDAYTELRETAEFADLNGMTLVSITLPQAEALIEGIEAAVSMARTILTATAPTIRHLAEVVLRVAEENEHGAG